MMDSDLYIMGVSDVGHPYVIVSIADFPIIANSEASILANRMRLDCRTEN